MRYEHPDLPGRSLRLGYCMNLHAAEDLDGVYRGMREITVPLAERLYPGRSESEGFGVGVWLPADVAMEITRPDQAEALDRYAEFFAEHGLDPFTFNAFPYGGFHSEGLKERVFNPTWKNPLRTAYTLAVLQIALALHGDKRERSRHVSISTHCGMFGEWVGGPADLDECCDSMLVVALTMAQMEDESGLRMVLSLEPEPRSSANDTRELSGLHERLLARSHQVLGRGFDSLAELSERIVHRHLGTCLDTCHAAVEYESADEAFARSTSGGTPLGKMQFSSALDLVRPSDHDAARQALFALAEPTYLHQVTGRRSDGELVRARDLPDVERAYASDLGGLWHQCDSWRCHFHVPVDLTDAGVEGLGTTREAADRALVHALDNPDRWGADELHVEIETYTWDLLPDHLGGTLSRVDGLVREYEHVFALLDAHGWRRVGD